jgi:hypothetical protein
MIVVVSLENGVASPMNAELRVRSRLPLLAQSLV